MSKIKKIILISVVVLLGLLVLYLLISYRKKPEQITYGVSFNTLYARELGLNWKETYLAILDDLGVRNLRLAAHWNMVEPEKDSYNFTELDFQLREAEARDASVVFAVGRRLPRWPECHIPVWQDGATIEDEQKEILEYLELTVNRYKDNTAIKYWQVENEPFLEVFATEHCGELDVDFLEKEIALVKKLDPSRPVLVTDSGNLGLWWPAYKRGDAFGTSVYVYLWNPDVGPFKSFLPASWYRFKFNVLQLLFGQKEGFLIELSAEPWLLAPVVDTDIETQLDRMNIDKMNEIIDFAENTRFEKQFLWGAEWWYWMKNNGHPEFWDRGKELYN